MTVRLRLWFLRGVFGLCLLGLLARLWFLQVIEGDRYRAYADRIRFRTISLDAPRGVIYDQGGNLLAKNLPSFALHVVPGDLPKDEEARYQVILRALQILQAVDGDAWKPVVELPPPPSEPPDGLELGTAQPVETPEPFTLPQYARTCWDRVEELLYVAPSRPVVVAQNVSRDAAMILAEAHLDLPGVQVVVHSLRSYPTGQLTAHVVGYVGRIPEEAWDMYQEQGYEANDWVGLTGLERQYEAYLRGEKGVRNVEVDVLGREVRTVGEVVSPTAGHNLVLSLDLNLQRATEAALRRGMRATGVESGVAIVMDPRDGRILSMVSLPAYDNNLFASGISLADYQKLNEDPHRPLINHAVGGLYPPGSIFKIVPAAAALEEGVVTPNTRLDCQGIMWVPHRYFPDDRSMDQPFYCWIHKSGTGHGPLAMRDAIAVSCDIYFYKLAGGYQDFQGLGLEALRTYAQRFGLGERTGIDLPTEAAGLVPDAKWKRLQWAENWVTGDTYNMAIGQGFILATPLQMLNATAVIANGGTLYRPRMVLRVVDEEGKLVKDFPPEVIREVPVDLKNLEVVREGMLGAVEWGTAKGAYLPEVAVAGKTGTAEFPGPRDAQGHLPTHAWFTAFAPYDDPEVALIVFLYSGGEGSKTAVPVAAEILRYYFGL
ncbi:MAG: penicillin-binding protein 2 [Anaerolineae bacterium]